MGRQKPENYLCSDAAARGKRAADPTACQTCQSPCDHGIRWLEQLGLDTPKRVRLPMIECPEGKQHRSLMQYINRGR